MRNLKDKFFESYCGIKHGDYGEPWKICDSDNSTKVIFPNGGIAFEINGRYSSCLANRIVSCINACKNLASDDIDKWGVELGGSLERWWDKHWQDCQDEVEWM